MDIIDWDDTGCCYCLSMTLTCLVIFIYLVSTPKLSQMPPTPESLGGTGKGTAGEGPPSERENTHLTT